jgi:hypothetical protein
VLGLFLLNTILINETQPQKAYDPIIVNPLPIVTLVRSSQSLNTDGPIEVTLLGSTKFVIDVFENAKFSIVPTPSGNVTSTRLPQLRNAEFPMFLTPLPITTYLR